MQDLTSELFFIILKLDRKITVILGTVPASIVRPAGFENRVQYLSIFINHGGFYSAHVRLFGLANE